MRGVKDLLTYDLPVDAPFPPIVQRIVALGREEPAHPHPQDRQEAASTRRRP